MLIFPTGLDARLLCTLASRPLRLTDDQGTPAEAMQKVIAALSDATNITLPNYFSHPRADLWQDRPEE
jgi:hypothetical protein